MSAEKPNIPRQEQLSFKEKLAKALWSTAMVYWEGATGQTPPEGWLKTRIGLQEIEAYAQPRTGPENPETGL